MDFSNKVVLVTGASRGLGREIALQFSNAGATVAVHYNSDATAANDTLALLKTVNNNKQTAAGGDFREREPFQHCAFQCNLAEEHMIPIFVSNVEQKYGRIDILVNNAGIYEEQKIGSDALDYVTWRNSWKRVCDVNLFGVANLSFCVAEVMKRGGHGGRIVNVSSRGAFRGEPDAPAYGASKAALNSLGQSLAKALAQHNIFVATVAPGFIDTEMAKDVMSGPLGPCIAAQSPLNRIARVDEVAHGVLFLASDRAAFMTGAILDINGASYLRS